MPIEEALTEDERKLMRLVELYATWAPGTFNHTAAESSILAHYRKAKKEEWVGGYQSCREDHGIINDDDRGLG